MKRVKSLYTDSISFQIVCQYDALYALDSLENRRDLEDVEDNKSKLIFDTNPCHHDYPFAGVQFNGIM